MLLIDLDHFKSINDRFGHATGDKVLQIFAKVAQSNLRQNDLIGRLGGEEFTVVLADASIDNAYLVADRLRNAFAVAAAAVVDDQALHATASVGVSVIVDPAPGPRAPDHTRRPGALSGEAHVVAIGSRSRRSKHRSRRELDRRRARAAERVRTRGLIREQSALA